LGRAATAGAGSALDRVELLELLESGLHALFGDPGDHIPSVVSFLPAVRSCKS
jgi:hypothetical protein